jgi:putative transport protein
MIPIALPGGEGITLGMAGGPLLVALVLAHAGKMGRVVGHIPRPTRQLLQELGLVFFLASAGVKGGASLVETVMTSGPSLFLAGMMITLLPMVAVFLLAGRIFKLNNLQALGGICGGMTSTPALGAITARTDSQLPVLSYATAYPVALIVMTVFAKILIAVIA